MYILELTKLKKGDILLTGSGEKLSRFIKKVTSGSFSHAILYVGNASYIHSDKNGVHAGNIQRLLFESEDDIQVYRANKKIDFDMMCDFARSQVGKEYSIKGAINSKTKLNIKLTTNRQFCSKLVAESYAYASFGIVEDFSRCTPKDIEVSDKLSEVPSVAREASPSEMKFASSASPISKQDDVVNHILSRARDITSSDIQTMQDLTVFMIENHQFDHQISDLIKSTEYLTLFDDQVEKNPWRYDFELFISRCSSVQELRNESQREMNMSIDMLKRYKHMLETYAYLHKEHNLEFTLLNQNLYMRLVERVLKQLEVAKYSYETIT